MIIHLVRCAQNLFPTKHNGAIIAYMEYEGNSFFDFVYVNDLFDNYLVDQLWEKL